jgi:predicted amidohydrolase
MACLAANHSITVVFNMGALLCNSSSLSNPYDCPVANRLQYNTDVVFSSTGALQAVYFKTHLYMENQFQPGLGQAITFKSDFGPTFGIFTCYDIMFEHPSRDLLAQGVTDFVFPSWWVNVPPFILATQMQQGFSRYYGVNLLAANSGASWFNGGSGIYSRGTALAAYYNTSYLPSSRMLLVDVPQLPPVRSYHSGGDKQSSARPSAPLAPRVRSGRATPAPSLLPGARVDVLPFESGKGGRMNVSATGLQCSFSWQFASDLNSVAGTYAAVTFSGVYNELHLQLCGLVACSSPSTCGELTLSAMTSGSLAGFSVQAQLLPAAVPLAFLADADAQLLDDDTYTVEASAGRCAIRSQPSFNPQPLLSAVVWAQILD